jgi:hypothetical protein
MTMTERHIPAPEVTRPVFNADWTDEERAPLTDLERQLLPVTILDGDTREEQLSYLQRFARYVELQNMEVDRAVRISRRLGVG